LQSRLGYSSRLGQAEREYLSACRDKEQFERAEREVQLARTDRAQRRIGQLLAAIAVILLVAGAWNGYQTRDIQDQTALVLASDAKNASDKGLYERALRFAAMGVRSTWLLNHSAESEVELSRAADASPQLWVGNGHTGWVVTAAFSPDGKQVVTASADETARVWDVHWHTQYHGDRLLDAVCREKLIGDSIVTEADTQISPVLSGRMGEDVCTPPSFLSRIGKTLGLSIQNAADSTSSLR